MLAGKVLPTVPEEEFYPDAEAAGLPPASSPSVSSQQTALPYSLHVTAAPQTFPATGVLNSSPFSTTEFILPHTPPSHNNRATQNALQELPTVQMLPQEPADLSLSTPAPAISPGYSSGSPASPTGGSSYPFDPVQPHSVIARSRSQHELDTSGTGISSPHQQDFAVPQTYSRRRSHSGSVTLTNTSPNPVISATSVPSLPSAVKSSCALQHLLPTSPVQAASVRNQTISQAAPNTLYTLAHPIKTDADGHQGQISSIPTASPGTIFAHFIPTDNFSGCPPMFNQSDSSLSTMDPIANNKARNTRPLMPRITPSDVPGSNISSTTMSCTSSTSGAIAPKGAIQTMPMMGPQAILSSVALSPVTPSSLKSLHGFPQVSKFSFATFSTGASLPLDTKLSPPHAESSPPHSSSVPSPPNKPFRPKNEHERYQYKEHRRVCHINAEQKRRCNIKNNFDALHSIIPSISQNSSSKVSKATMLHKGAEYIQQLKEERKSLEEQARVCRDEIDKLSQDISNAQAMLPATGAPITHSRHNKFREKYEKYAREKTSYNWKFHIFSLVIDPLIDSYNKNVYTSSVDDLCRSSLAWVDQHCSLNVLRPIASNAMRKLSTSTSVLTHPENLPEDIYSLMKKDSNKNSHNASPFSPSFPS